MCNINGKILFWDSIRGMCLQINWLHNIASSNSKKRTCMGNITHFPPLSPRIQEYTKSVQSLSLDYVARLVSLFIHCGWTGTVCCLGMSRGQFAYQVHTNWCVPGEWLYFCQRNPWNLEPASWSLSLSSLMTWSHTLLISDVSSAGFKWLDLLFFLGPAEDTSEISNMRMRLHVIREDNAVVTTLTV